jgi:hypothetical protein
MSLRLVRKNSLEPNVLNSDDSRGLAYAGGGYNGIIKGFGQECPITLDSANSKVLIGTGEIIIDAWQVVFSGENAIIYTTNYFYTVCLKIDLTDIASEKVTLLATPSSSGYPDTPIGQDLIKYTQGIAYLPLYNFRVVNGVMNYVKLARTIERGLSKKATDFNAEEGSIKETFESIEERLTNLGFSEGSCVITNNFATTENYVKRQGNYVFGRIIFSSTIAAGEDTLIATVSEIYKPKVEEKAGAKYNTSSGASISGIYNNQYVGFNTEVDDIIVNTNGEIRFKKVAKTAPFSNSVSIKIIVFGYEANPRT